MELKIINIQAKTPRSKKIVNAFDITLNGEKLNMAFRTRAQTQHWIDTNVAKHGDKLLNFIN